MRLIPEWEEGTPEWIKVVASVQFVMLFLPMAFVASLCFVALCLWPFELLVWLLLRRG